MRLPLRGAAWLCAVCLAGSAPAAAAAARGGTEAISCAGDCDGNGAVTIAEPNLRAVSAGGDVVHGADIGIPVTVHGEDSVSTSYFFFGDTGPLDPAAFGQGMVKKESADVAPPFVARKGVMQGDALAVSSDADADDGIQITALLRNREEDRDPVWPLVDDDGVRPLFVAGVHDNPAYHFAPDIPGDACIGGASLNTPTGAFALEGLLFMVTGIQNHFRDPDLPAFSFLSASRDGGLTWTLLNGGEPLSRTEKGPGGKFIHVAALVVDAREYGDPRRSEPCPLPEPPASDPRGVLLFGTGTWLHTGLYLGFVYAADLLDAVAHPDRRGTAFTCTS